MSDSKELIRCSHDYVNLSNQYVIKSKQFRLQYAHIYSSRLWSLTPFVKKAAHKNWGDDIIIRKLADVQPGEQCVVIGTIVKRMKHEPNVLIEIGNSYHMVPQPPKNKNIHDLDCIILEDENQRIQLIGNINVHRVITGSIVAVYGYVDENDGGKFLVSEYTYRTFLEQIPRPVFEIDKYVVIVSGLNVGRDASSLFHLQLLADLLTGQLGNEVAQTWMAEVVRLVVAGNIVSESKLEKKATDMSGTPTNVIVKDAISTLDDFFTQLAAGMDVDIMPGPNDPTNFMLPQQPLHHCLFPKATRYETFHCVTNPYSFSIDGLEILGTSGQPATDICKFTEFEDHLEVIEHTLKVGHIVPTSPDSVASYPQSDDDPFIIRRCPHVYFSGNAPHLSKKILKGDDDQTTLLISIPPFSQTFTCAAINLRTLEVMPILIDASDK